MFLKTNYIFYSTKNQGGVKIKQFEINLHYFGGIELTNIFNLI